MSSFSEVSVYANSFNLYENLLSPDTVSSIQESFSDFKLNFPHTVWHINSTAKGGGVAEMLRPLLSYCQDLAIPTRWAVIGGKPDFFAITKRIHNNIHGFMGDGESLGKRERVHFEENALENLSSLREIVPNDIIVLHDPQTAALIPHLKKNGNKIVWRSHIGHEKPNHLSNRAWSFLKPYLEQADALVFSRREFVLPWMEADKIHIIPPSIDIFTPKNKELTHTNSLNILAHCGILRAPKEPSISAAQVHDTPNKMPAALKRYADVLHCGPLPGAEDQIITQISRWDRLKDMVGVLRCFEDVISEDSSCYLILAGPTVHGVADDPEASLAFNECLDCWRNLPHFKRSRVQLVCLPMTDIDENALIVNALQRCSTVILQKSLYEGFGLTVTEAMWKQKVVVASAVGGIKDQIEDGITGRLISDPGDLTTTGKAVLDLLKNQGKREQIAAQAKEAITRRSLMPRHLQQYLTLFKKILE